MMEFVEKHGKVARNNQPDESLDISKISLCIYQRKGVRYIIYIICTRRSFFSLRAGPYLVITLCVHARVSVFMYLYMLCRCMCLALYVYVQTSMCAQCCSYKAEYLECASYRILD